MTDMTVDDVRDVWIVIKNTDDIEGRGLQYISHICEIEATAVRIAKGGYVMGSNCPIEKVLSYKVKGRWVQPSFVEPPTGEDRKRQARINAERSTKGRAVAALEEAKRLGLSEDHISALKAVI